MILHDNSYTSNKKINPLKNLKKFPFPKILSKKFEIFMEWNERRVLLIQHDKYNFYTPIFRFKIDSSKVLHQDIIIHRWIYKL